MREVTAAVMIEDNRLFLARRGPDDKLAGLWELPGGKVEAGETPEDCLARELDEELGMTVRVGDKIAASDYVYEHGAFRLLAFATERLPGPIVPEVHDMYAWVTVDEIDAYELAPADQPIVERIRRGNQWYSSPV